MGDLKLCEACYEHWIKPDSSCSCGWHRPPLKKFTVTRYYQGYVRGEEVREVIATDEAEAQENFHAGTLVSENTIRDDTSTTDWNIE